MQSFQDDIPIGLRHAVHGDLAFFFSSLLQSFRYSSGQTKIIPINRFYDAHKRVIESVMRRPTAALIIAHDAEDPNTIIGFCLCEPSRAVVHYVYVKKPFRNFGVMRRLISYSGIDPTEYTFSHYTPDISDIRRKYQNIKYDPYELLP